MCVRGYHGLCQAAGCDCDCHVVPADPVIRKPEFPPASRRPAHEGVTKHIATLEDENVRLKAELSILRRRYDTLLAQTNERV